MNGILNIKRMIISLIKDAVYASIESNDLPEFDVPEITIERPQRAGFGDFATSFPLKITKLCSKNPMDIANIIVANMTKVSDFESVVVAKPGFINFTLSNKWLTEQVSDIIEKDNDFGNIDIGKNSKIQFEFVSANPTGPLHIGHGRGAVLGSTLANIFEATGYDVNREYYINDAGNQIHLFSKSLWIRYQQELGKNIPMIEDGYQGKYMIDLAKEMVREYGPRFDTENGEEEMAQIGLKMMLESIKASLERLDVTFDNWFSEKSLFANGEYDTIMAKLTDKGFVSKHDGAVWFDSTALGEDKDNVIVRSDGTVTYFGTDIAYHYNKFAERKMDKVVDIWGADHQGHISRMKAVLAALDLDPDKLTVLISQLVSLKRGGETVKFSKRSGEMITLSDLIDEVGSDACRYFFLTRSADSQMEFDLDLAKKESSENPVFYIQYAHARIASILRNAQEPAGVSEAKYTESQEYDLIRKMIMLPEVLELCSVNMEPHHLPHYALDLATSFHAFYHDCHVICEDDPETTYSRIELIKAAKTVLYKTLRLMGMSAPESM